MALAAFVDPEGDSSSGRGPGAHVTHTPIVELQETIVPRDGRNPTRRAEHTFVSPVPHVALMNPLPEFPLEGEPEVLAVIDMPTFRSISGLIIMLTWAMILISVLFVCLGRSDFNLVLYLLGYHVWCIQSKRLTVPIPVVEGRYPRTKELRVVTKQTTIDVTWMTCLFAASLLVDLTWLALSANSWAAHDELGGDTHHNDLVERRLILTKTAHQLAISGSTCNMFLKACVVGLSVLWLVQQKRHQAQLMRMSTT